jgi:hypothetical protein
MRRTLIIACAIGVFAAGAKAQDALKPCRQIKDDGKRLKCYDRLDRIRRGSSPMKNPRSTTARSSRRRCHRATTDRIC